MEQLLICEASAKPFIKWAGGKQSLSQKLIPLFPKEYDRYFEPFVGGGSMFLNLNHPNTVINDYNDWLIDTYKAIKTNWKSVAKLLDQMQNTKEDFLIYRSILPTELSKYEKAAHFIYLNKTCFRGLFRVNQKGMFNVPYGEYDRRYYSPENLKSVSSQLKKVEIRCGDFEFGLDGITKDDFTYMDPPYYKLGGHSDFNRYTKLQFKESDQIKLAGLCNELDQQGTKWAVSNSNTDFIKKLFKGYNFHEIDSRREINLNSKKRDIKELLITNY